jgi:mannose-6-phosphate isomerase-like protein (cupin superfamily)
MSKLETVQVDNCTVYHLPGRDWYYLLGPQNCSTRNLAFGLAEFPGNSLAGVHTHDTQEEILYTLSGIGTILTTEQEIRMESGTAVFIPPGLAHQIRVDGDEPLKVVTLFSPPVMPGAYDLGFQEPR